MPLAEEAPSWLRATQDNTPLMGSGNPFGPPGNPFADDNETMYLDQPAEKVKAATKKKATKKQQTPSKSTNKNVNNSNKKAPEEMDWHEDDNEETLLVGKRRKKKKLKVVRSPTKHCILTFFHGFEFISSIPLLCLLAIQIFPMVFVPIKVLGFLQTIIRVYISFFVIILIFVEWGVPILGLRENYLLQTFFTRGFLHTFAAVLAMEEAYTNTTPAIDDAYNNLHLEWAPVLGRQITCWSVFGIGCMYIIFGIFCLQILRNTLSAQHQKKVDEYEGATEV